MSEGAAENPGDDHVAGQLLDLCDELDEFGDCFSFMFDAVASLAAEESALNTSTIEGLRCLSQWMKDRMNHIGARLGAIQKKAYAGAAPRKQ